MQYKIDVNTPPLVLRKIYKKNDGYLPGMLDTLSSTDLTKLIKIHNGQTYEMALYQNIACHRNVTEEIHQLLLDNSQYEYGVANAVATSGKASIKILERLLKHSSEHVVEHAQLAIKYFKKDK
ncbi:hypothetical protein [Lysinibacillus sp. FJAT-14745]|uniref:hypothetical protein n=1 Tax=Lysinibacillus sp. FJAT-14745 TaxID=1704289 RepID=UPI0012E29C03|nr:hypothetical protein [Lysinibacillus sp. FJAT-14745]